MFRGILILLLLLSPAGEQKPVQVVVDYPEDQSIFPLEFPPPTFLWRDASPADAWIVKISFAEGGKGIETRIAGKRFRLGEIDARAGAPVKVLGEIAEAYNSTRTWAPDPEMWAAIKRNSTAGPATVTITGYRRADPGDAISIGRLRLSTSADPIGAPIFYRDVPLMPSETEKGVIKPLDQKAVPLISWKLRDVASTSSRVVMEGLHTCANCHSFSGDGKLMGMDVDGPQNDKGLYAMAAVQPYMSIGKSDIVAWSTFRGKLGGRLRVGFMSQVSLDGKTVVTTIHDPGLSESEYQRRKNAREVALNYYVANFKDYRFLQVFFPTRGILAWYSRESGELKPLPGGDDPGFVQTNAVWSPDGKYLVFARAEAKEPYAPSAPAARYANDPNETQIRYDLYRIPFRDGQGGRPEPVAGASRNGKSNTFPKISPDGKWTVYVQSRNGLLMRPDSELYIVPASGGAARRMRCNTRLMNSWHSFSPNGRWMVFASKSRSPYTQMFLTHIDGSGNDSPAILIENATAANRAVNLPEFVNIPAGGLLRIDAPVTDYYRVVDLASELMKQGKYEASVAEWKKAVALEPGEALAYSNLGTSLGRMGRELEAISQFERALELSPEYPEAHNNLGAALIRSNRIGDAIHHFETAIQLSPKYGTAFGNLGSALIRQGRVAQAIPVLEKAVEYEPQVIDSHYNLAIARMRQGQTAEAIAVLQRAAGASGGRHLGILRLLSELHAKAGRFSEAAEVARNALAIAIEQQDSRLERELRGKIAFYETIAPIRP